MKLEKITIRDFKRFANLEISNIPSTAKLVLLTGPNGSGKTSLFEAFNYWMKISARQDWNYDPDYYLRPIDSLAMTPEKAKRTRNLAQETWDKITPKFHGLNEEIKHDQEACRKAFYIRSAYRHSPDFTIDGLQKLDDILNDSSRASKLVLSESRVQDNYQRLVGMSLESLYDNEQRDRTAGQITDELIGEVKKAMLKVFDGLVLEGPGNPLEGGTFRFTKGDSSNFHYKNLSGGEKAAFDLLLDFIVKRKKFDDTIFCVDEPELHMHTRLQATLLEAMFDLIPDNCQLWLSTHSIGMARKAAELNSANPGQVAFIDFHEQNFDQPVRLEPIKPGRQFWQQMFHTALDDLAELVVPEYVVFCEGRKVNQTGKKPSFDAAVYQKIFSPWHPEIEFIPLGGTNEVQFDGKAFDYLLTKLAPGIKTWKVLDQDDRNSVEIDQLKDEETYVLSRRDIESFLWDDEVLLKLCEIHNSPEAFSEIQLEKQSQIQSLPGRGKPADDIKAISDSLYNKCKRVLNLHGCGNTAEAFSIEKLAPLIQPGMAIYNELAEAVLAPLRIQDK
ncbi:AAA family ATPase [Marinobacter sp. GH_1]|uniref:AAA family ATPase n=1 Tax=Marinobacter sp. GH_1 TaxID=3402164 RepID=UPI003B436AAA